MIVTPTTTIAILGGTPGESEWGDPVESEGTVRTGVPAAIHQQRRMIVPEGQTAPMAVRFWTGYLPNGTEINDQQRIRDERTGKTYTIDSVEVPAHPGMPQDIQLDLRSVD